MELLTNLLMLVFACIVIFLQQSCRMPNLHQGKSVVMLCGWGVKAASIDAVSYDFIRIILASHQSFYIVHMCQKSLNFTDEFHCYKSLLPLTDPHDTVPHAHRVVLSTQMSTVNVINW